MSADGRQLGYRPGLDALRGTAALTVVAVHSGVGPPRGARVAVTAFFVLSGFLITSGLLTQRGKIQSYRNFYERRARRLVPALVPLLAAGWVLNVWLYPTVDPFMATLAGFGFLTNGYLSLGHGVGVNGGLWSLSVEEHFYLLWPLLVWKLPARRLPVVIVGLIVGSLVAGQIAPLSSPIRYWMTPFRIGELALGAGAALLWHNRDTLRITRSAAVAACGGLFAIASRPISEDYIPVGPAVAGVCSAIVLLYLMESPGWAPLNWSGRLSYGIYLWHAPIYLATAHATGFERWALLAVSLPGSVAIAWISHRWVESPWLVRRHVVAGEPQDSIQGGRRQREHPNTGQ